MKNVGVEMIEKIPSMLLILLTGLILMIVEIALLQLEE
jgi:hypothetical protein